ncbi:hypothetical protein GQ53DRAFT_756067 [Thozetella sp. PMI_491]|nr:hypothetical protein GQ53DRAFT_756067 [Thozetella sp. PMI_491]
MGCTTVRYLHRRRANAPLAAVGAGVRTGLLLPLVSFHPKPTDVSAPCTAQMAVTYPPL